MSSFFKSSPVTCIPINDSLFNKSGFNCIILSLILALIAVINGVTVSSYSCIILSDIVKFSGVSGTPTTLRFCVIK